jgi:hypothetical protein
VPVQVPTRMRSEQRQQGKQGGREGGKTDHADFGNCVDAVGKEALGVPAEEPPLLQHALHFPALLRRHGVFGDGFEIPPHVAAEGGREGGREE